VFRAIANPRRQRRTTLQKPVPLEVSLCVMKVSKRSGRRLVWELGALIGNLTSLGAIWSGQNPDQSIDSAGPTSEIKLGEGEDLLRRYEIPSCLYGRDIGHLYITSRRVVLHRQLSLWRWQTHRFWETTISNVGEISAESVLTDEHRPVLWRMLTAYLKFALLSPFLLILWLWLSIVPAVAVAAIAHYTNKTVAVATAIVILYMEIRGLTWIFWRPRNRPAISLSLRESVYLPIAADNTARRTAVRTLRNARLNGSPVGSREESDPFTRTRTPLMMRRPPTKLPVRPLVPVKEKSIEAIVTDASKVLAALSQGP
jgi:hypothetical protein